MDDAKEPGIVFNNVILKELHFSRKPKIEPKPELDIKVEIENQFSENKKRLVVEVKFTVTEKEDLFSVICSMIGVFSISEGVEPNMSLEEFAEYAAPAHLFPYIRETVASTTLKSGIAPVILPLVNLRKMAKQSKNQ